MQMEKGLANQADHYAGQQLRKLRKSVSVSQKELAGAIGITFQQIQKYENGLNRISAGKLNEIARFFNVSVLYFFDVPEGEQEIVSRFRRCSPRRRHLLLELAETYAEEAKT